MSMELYGRTEEGEIKTKRNPQTGIVYHLRSLLHNWFLQSFQRKIGSGVVSRLCLGTPYWYVPTIYLTQKNTYLTGEWAIVEWSDVVFGGKSYLAHLGEKPCFAFLSILKVRRGKDGLRTSPTLQRGHWTKDSRQRRTCAPISSWFDAKFVSKNDVCAFRVAFGWMWREVTGVFDSRSEAQTVRPSTATYTKLSYATWLSERTCGCQAPVDHPTLIRDRHHCTQIIRKN